MENTNVENEEKRYNEILDRYFHENEVIIKYLPDEYCKAAEHGASYEKIGTIKEFIDYLKGEKQFWTYELTQGCNRLQHYDNHIMQAEECIASAISHADNDDAGTTYMQLRHAVDYVAGLNISSKSSLANDLFVKYKDRSSVFRLGFLFALNCQNSRESDISDYWQGFYFGMEYLRDSGTLENLSGNKVNAFKTSVTQATNELSKINQQTTQDYYEIKKRMDELVEINDLCLKEQKKQYDEQIATYDQQINELEKLYTEKLKLSAPADYWAKTAMAYKISGIIWLVVSILLGVGSVVGLAYFIIFMPDIYAMENFDWFNTFKITTILAIMTSIAIYILRTTVKVSMSSLHLSRDAKEREKLAFFYLALQNEKAVSEKEREIIITSLFSRSDSGLLKGDSSPTMPTNIADILSK